MTYFQDDNGNQIEAPEDLQIYKSSVNLFDFTIKGNFSTSFQVPNNSFYKNSFQYWTPLQIPSNGFKATIFNFVRNGNIIDRGQLVLERDDYDFLYFFFISGNSNWITLIPDISIRDINYENYKITFSGDVGNYGSSTQGFCFPIVDWFYKGQKNGIAYQDFYQDTSYNYESCLPDFYPCFFLKSAMDSIFTYCQLKIGGDILNDPLYQNMIITPDSGVITRSDKFLSDRKVTIGPSINRDFLRGTKLNLDSIISNGSLLCWDSSTQRYNVNKDCILDFSFNITTNFASLLLIKIFKNGSAALSYPDNYPTDSFNNQLLVKDTAKTNDPCFLKVSDGDYLEFYSDVQLFQGSFAASGFTVPNNSATQGQSWVISNGGAFGTLPTITVNNGDIVYSKVNTPGTVSGNWGVIPSGTPGSAQILSGSQITIQPRKILNNYNYSETLRASDILPDIKMIDLIKFVCQYFCIIPSFDKDTSTVNFNKLDNFDYTKSVNWSEFLQKLENNYQIQTARYNYIRFKQVDDELISSYKFNNNLNFGDCLIQGQSSSKIVNDIFQFPFGPALDKIGEIDSILKSQINLCSLEPDGEPYSISSITNSSGTAIFNLSSNNVIENLGGNSLPTKQLVYIYGSSNYQGLSTSNGPVTLGGNSFTFGAPIAYSGNSKGFVQPLRFNFKKDQSRILFFTQSRSISSISTHSSLTFINLPAGSGTTSQGSIGWSYFSKPTTAFSVASFKQGLNLDYFIPGYNDVPRRLDYYKNLSRILNAPYVKAWLYLPEDEYAKFNFGNFVYIKDKDQQRYYYVDSIENYKDSKTLVQVNMLLLI